MKKLKLGTFILMGIILMVIPLLGACGEEEAPHAPTAPTTPPAVKPE
jgi:hypothetical protein